jgi:hypothetical protein
MKKLLISAFTMFLAHGAKAGVTWIGNPADQICANPGAGGVTAGPVLRSPDTRYLPSWACAGGISPPLEPFTATVGPVVYSLLGAFASPGGIAGPNGVYFINSTYFVPTGITIIDPADPKALRGVTREDLVRLGEYAVGLIPEVGPATKAMHIAADIFEAVEIASGPIGDTIVDDLTKTLNEGIQDEINTEIGRALYGDCKDSCRIFGPDPVGDSEVEGDHDALSDGIGLAEFFGPVAPAAPSVPELSTWTMLLMGLAGLTTVSLRKRAA